MENVVYIPARGAHPRAEFVYGCSPQITAADKMEQAGADKFMWDGNDLNLVGVVFNFPNTYTTCAYDVGSFFDHRSGRYSESGVTAQLQQNYRSSRTVPAHRGEWNTYGKSETNTFGDLYNAPRDTRCVSARLRANTLHSAVMPIRTDELGSRRRNNNVHDRRLNVLSEARSVCCFWGALNIHNTTRALQAQPDPTSSLLSHVRAVARWAGSSAMTGGEASRDLVPYSLVIGVSAEGRARRALALITRPY
ncbi:hypothetical protein EVAR_81804_1 [Eumeta japonica]|uniref:Uncharacterized protein n=1 Tax=Eumeta variegata TaxID=151549 RepID=A0A4C1UHX3_EUMVA|nr:hypothetical protein EVAR_81804_1 [Eumeta japonica]